MDHSSAASSSRFGEDTSSGIEWAARAGYAAKGAVYAVIGGLALQLALGRGGETSSTRGALERIASAPFGRVMLGIVTLGLAAYTLWRLLQAVVDPEGDGDGEGGAKRWAKRAFFFVSAVAYGLLAYYGASLVLGSGGGGGSGAGSAGGGSGGWAARLMQETWGVWLVGLIGAGIVGRGGLQLVKAYTQSFKKKIRSFDLGPGTSTWVIRASRLGLTARGVVFGIIGGSVIYAAVTHDPQEARGLEGALDILVTRPWLLGAVGLGLLGYAVYQGVKARYRMIGV